MTGTAGKVVRKFIPRSFFPDYRVPLADFKGHHSVAMTKLEQLAPQIDLVLEMRDSRAPISTGNVLLDRPLRGKDKIVLYSKKDLTKIHTSLLKQWHGAEQDYMLISARQFKDQKKLLDICKKKYKSMNPPPPLGLRIIITGMPNVGKSFLVNALRGIGLGKYKSVARTGGQPGVTRATSEMIAISHNPPIYLYDTPGVSLPQVKSSETMICLSLVGAISPTKVDPVIVADYLLYILNVQDPTGGYYKEYLRFPTNDITVLLRSIAKKINRVRYVNKKIVVDETGTALYWVDRWRQGKNKGAVFERAAMAQVGQLDTKEEFAETFIQEKERVDSMKIEMNRNETTKMSARRAFKQKRADRSNVLFKL